MAQFGIENPLLVSGAMAGLAVGWAAVEDVCRRTIPDTVPVLLSLLGLALPLIRDGQFPWFTLAIAVAVFLGLCVLHNRGWLGGGDVKLAAALVLFVGAERAADFAVATAFAGGLLSLLYMAGWLVARRTRAVRRLLRRFGPAARTGLRRLLLAETHRIATRHSVPYGVALAAGGLLTLAQQPGGAAWF